MTDLSPRDRRRLDRLTQGLAALSRKVDQQAQAQHSAWTTIQQGHGPKIVNEDGETVGWIGGPSGELVQAVPTAVPSAPSAPEVDLGALSVQVTVLDTQPGALRHCLIHASLSSDSSGAVVGVITPGSTSSAVTLPAGLWHVRVQWELVSGEKSALSAATVVDVTPLVDTEDLESVLSTAREELQVATEEANAQIAELGSLTATARADLDAAVQRLAQAETVLAPLPEDLAAAQQAAEDAADSALAAEARAVEANNRAMTRLANGNFESGLDYWSGGATLTTDSHSGGSAAEVGGPSATALTPESFVPVIPGQIWELQFHFKARNASAQSGQVAAAFTGTDGAVIGAWHTAPGAGDGLWSTTTHRFTVPAGVDSVRPRITRRTVDSAALWAIDDVSLRDVTDVVRLEKAAQAAKKAGDDAMSQAKTLELAMGGLEDRLSAAESDIATAATEAEQNLSALDEALREAFSDADAALKSEAASDATTKANAARTAAEAEALRLAQAEATAAQSAAEATAAADALAKANAARDAAISSAAGDATTKAKAAEDAAKVAAAADAKAKADAAQTEAIRVAAADAKTKADAAQAEALRLAKLDATAKADAAKSAAIGAAAADAQTKFDAAKELADAAQAKADALALAGGNLVINGSAETGGTTPWPESMVSLAPEETPLGFPGAFTISGGRTFFSTQDIPVDPSRAYRHTAWIKGPAGQMHYLAIDQRDIDGNVVGHQHANRYANTQTKLAADLKPGDTKVQIVDPTNWGPHMGTQFRWLAVWPYKTAAGPTYQIEDGYTRHLARLDTPSPATLSGNTITLPEPWPGPLKPAGSDVAVTLSGSNYIYPMNKRSGDGDWEKWEGTTIAGVSTGRYGEPGANNNQLRPGTATIRVGFLMNYQRGGTDPAWFTGVRLVDDTAHSEAVKAQQAADAAQAAADAAQAGADAAHAAAGAAQSSADAAMTRAGTAETNAKAHADTLPKVLHGTTAPSGTAPDGSVWFQHVGSLSGAVTGQWNRVGGQWVSTPIRSEAIANLDVGKLTAGSAVVGETVTQKLLANEAVIKRLTVGVQAWIDGVLIKDGTVTADQITVTNELITDFFAANRALINEELVVRGNLIANHATIISAALKNLSVTEKATFAQAFADEFWAKMAVIDKLTAQTAWIGGAMLKDGAVTAKHITASESLTATVAQFLKVTAGMIQSNAFEGQTFTGGTFTGALFQTVPTLLRGVKLSSTGLRAWDDTGKLTANIDGKNNLLSGLLRTAPEGEAGLIIDPQNANAGRPAVFFSPDGSTTSDVAAIYTSSDWNLILRGRMTSGLRRGVQIDGGLELLGGGITGTQARILVDQVGGNFVHGRDGLGTEGSLTVAGTSQLTGNTTVSGILYANGRLRNSGAGNTSYSSNVYMDAYGFLYKSSSASRYKLNQQVTDVDDALLDLPVKTWQDREAVEAAEELSSRMGPLTEADTARLDAAQQAAADTMFGVVAEDVEKVDPRLATYDADGQVEGVAYDRFGPALIPLVRRQRDRIAELEKQVDALASRLDAAGL